MAIFSHLAQLIACLITIFFILWAFFPIRFEENDDIVMMLLSSGAYSGAPSENLVFINYYIGLLFKKLYSMNDCIAWYQTVFLGLISASLSLLTVNFYKDTQNINIQLCIFYILILIFGVNITIQMQFTTLSALLTAVGFWSLLITRKSVLLLISIFFIIVGFCIRFESAILVVIISAPLSFICLHHKKVSLGRLIACAAVILFGTGMDLLSDRAYKNIDYNYVKYNEIRGKINDNPNSILSSSSLPEGISYNDYKLLLDFFVDPNKINISKITDIYNKSYMNRTKLSNINWINAFRKLYNRLDVILMLVIIVVFSLTSRLKLLDYSLALSCLLIYSGSLVYIIIFATLKDRVVTSASISLIIALFYMSYKFYGRQLNLSFLLVLICIIGFQLININRKFSANFDDRIKLMRQLEVIRAWDGIIFVYKNHLIVEGAFLFYDDILNDYQKLVFAGWVAGHPENKLYNSHKDLLRKDAAIFLHPKKNFVDAIDHIMIGISKNYGILTEYAILNSNEYGVIVKIVKENGESWLPTRSVVPPNPF